MGIPKRFSGLFMLDRTALSFWVKWLRAYRIIDRELTERDALTLPQMDDPLYAPSPCCKALVLPALLGPGLLPLLEQAVLARLVVEQRPSLVFEIGTYLGCTTLLFAANTPPDTGVFTLDLPPCEQGEAPQTKYPITLQGIRAGSPRVGELFRDSHYAEKITQLFGDSATFDFSPYSGKMDLVFIDGNHQYDNVKSDSHNALKLIGPGGTVVWDDYETQYGADVVRCLNELGKRLQLRRISGTRLVIYRQARRLASTSG